MDNMFRRELARHRFVFRVGLRVVEGKYLCSSSVGWGRVMTSGNVRLLVDEWWSYSWSREDWLVDWSHIEHCAGGAVVPEASNEQVLSSGRWRQCGIAGAEQGASFVSCGVWGCVLTHSCACLLCRLVMST